MDVSMSGLAGPDFLGKTLNLLVGRLGLEPRTKALKGPCSTN
jgi:hypothetical protein